MTFLYGIALLGTGAVIGAIYMALSFVKMADKGIPIDPKKGDKKVPHRIVPLTTDNLKNKFIEEMHLVWEAAANEDDDLYLTRMETAIHTHKRLLNA